MVPSQSWSRSRSRRSPAYTLEDAKAPGSGERTLPPPHVDLGRALGPALAAILGKALYRWAGSRRPSMARLLRGALAGAGAAGVLYGFRRVMQDPRADDLTDELLAGAGRGLVYAAVLKPVIPGPALLRGALVGTIDYLAVPWGGVYALLQDLSPARRLPVINALVETGDAEDDPYVAFLIYGLALALLDGSDGSGED
jgi:hypothetical protein